MTLRGFFGGPPLPVLVRLVILSLVVGIVLSALGIDPFDIWGGLRDAVVRVWAMGFDALELAWRYLLLGAVIVIPIWLISRILAQTRRSE